MVSNLHITSPSPDPEGAAFWDAADQELFLLPKCTYCGHFHWHPRPICPFCMSTAVEWVPSTGLGRIYSSTLFRRGGGPYIVAYVDLDEGPRMLTNIWSDDLSQAAVGQRVQVVFVPAGDEVARKVPVFKAVSGA